MADQHPVLGAPRSRAPLPPEIPVERFEDGIVQCEVRTPYSMGTTNCWLVVGPEDVLCVDPGSDPDLAAEQLGEALAPFGRRIDAIATIVVTHTHPDHCGAAAGLSETVDAEVAIGAVEVGAMTGRPPSPNAVTAAWRALGAPAAELERAARRKLPYPPVATERIRPLSDGSQIRAGGRSWTVHVVGGHSPGHVVLESDAILIAGDHLLANILPAVHFGPALSEPNGTPADDPEELPLAPSVADFLTSMERFGDPRYANATVLPGHGPAFRGTARPVERARRYHRARCELIAARLEKRGPSTIWDLALDTYAGLVTAEGIDRRFASGAAEIAGRLEALRRAGRVTRTERQGTFVFAPA